MKFLVLEVLKREKPLTNVSDGFLVIEAVEFLRRCHGEPLSSSVSCVVRSGCLSDRGLAVFHAAVCVAPAKTLVIIFEYGTISKVIDKCADGIEVAARSDDKGRV